MNKNDYPSHASFYGIQRVVYKDDFVRELDKRLEFAYASSFSNHPEFGDKYNFIRITDTFLTGFNPKSLKNIIQKAFDLHYNIQILLLNPFSELAKLRNQVLLKNSEINHIVRLNRGLHKVIKAFEGDVDTSTLNNGDLNLALTNYKKIEDLADSRGINLKIKFTSQFTEFPVYIISEFALKGHLLENKAAENNPWIFSVDDPVKPDDVYDTYLRNFINLWKKSSGLKEIIEERVSMNFYKKDEVMKLKKMVGKNHFSETFHIISEILTSKFANNKSLYNEYINLSSQWDSFISKAYIKGSISDERISIEENRLRHGILSFIDKINEEQIP